MFIVLLFFLKNKSVFKNETTESNGLTYGSALIGDLVNKDTDLDGIPDWEEGLWGTDPTKKETTPGTPDSVAIEKLKIQQTAESEQGLPLLEGGNQDTGNLTETDKFSREFLATVSTLDQNGSMDQATIDKLSSSLADKIQNSVPRKVFLISDIKIMEDNSLTAIKKYNDTLDSIKKKYPVTVSALDVLQKFIVDENTVDVTVLSELDPIIEQTNKIITEMVKMSVPQSLSLLHLDFVNGIERLSENLSDIKFYDTDVIVALSAISQYEKNTTLLESATNNLGNTIKQKLNTPQ